jgi:uncharacterized protein involved in type VI secretion and phage assembly
MLKNPRLGTRVRVTAPFWSSAPKGALGTIALVAGVRGKSIYCDPSRLMVFVHWDSGAKLGEFCRHLERVKP